MIGSTRTCGPMRRKSSARGPEAGVLMIRSSQWISAADAQTGALEQRLDLVARDPGEIARDRVLEGASRHAIIEALLQVAVEQPVDQPRRKRVAGAEPIHDLDLIGPRPQYATLLPGDRRPTVLPDQGVLAERDGHHPHGEAAR